MTTSTATLTFRGEPQMLQRGEGRGGGGTGSGRARGGAGGEAGMKCATVAWAAGRRAPHRQQPGLNALAWLASTAHSGSCNSPLQGLCREPAARRT